MSTVESEGGRESASSVKLTRNAKGDAQWEIKIVSGEDAAEVARLRSVAIENYRELAQVFG